MMIYLSKIVLMYSQIIKLLKKSLPTVKTLTGMEWQNVNVKKNYNILVYWEVHDSALLKWHTAKSSLLKPMVHDLKLSPTNESQQIMIQYVPRLPEILS